MIIRTFTLALLAASLATTPAMANKPKNLFEVLFPKVKEKRLAKERAILKAKQAKIKKPARVPTAKYYTYKTAKRAKIDLKTPDPKQFAALVNANTNVDAVNEGATVRVPNQFETDLMQAETRDFYAESYLAKAVSSFYNDRLDYVWMNEDGSPNAKARSVGKLLQSAAAFGLEPLDYALEPAELVDDASEEDKARARLKNEIGFSVAALRYAMDARHGTINPNRLSGYHDFPVYHDEAGEVLSDIVGKGLPANNLKVLHPDSNEFRALQAEYASLQQASGDDVIELNTDILIKPGVSHKELPNVVAAIQKRASKELLEAQSETLAAYDSGEKYTPELVKLVKAYQKEAGLSSDGIVGRGTASKLAGVSSSNKIDRLKLAMERLRWLPDQLGERHVFINQPEYRARYFNNGEMKLSMRIVVGKKSNQTNFFYDEIEKVVYNPYWGVPRSIIVNEMLPKLRANPAYLDQRGYELSKGGRRVASSSVDWNSVGSNSSISVRQPPGSKNALGKVKILFPNKHAIYMHDTPAKHLFKRQTRAYSHGCVRLHDPQAMAAAVLGSSKGYVNGKISAGKNLTEHLSTKVPVYVSYFTAWPNDKGEIQYYADMYDRDKYLMRAMKATRKMRDKGLSS